MIQSSITIRIDEFTMQYGVRTIFQDIAFGVEPGHLLLITGPNGSGKTTLLDCLSGFRRPTGGRLLINAGSRTALFDFSKMFGVAGFGQSFGARQIARLGVRRTWQIPRLFSDLTIKEHFMLAHGEGQRTFGVLRPQIPRDDATWQEFETILSYVGIGHGEIVRRLSFGQQKLLQVALASCCAQTTLILDEPFSGLDSRARELLRSLLRNLKLSQKLAIILVEHPSNVAIFSESIDAVLDLGSHRTRSLIRSPKSAPTILREGRTRRDILRQSLRGLGFKAARQRRYEGALCTSFIDSRSYNPQADDKTSIEDPKSINSKESNELTRRLAFLTNYLRRIAQSEACLLTIEAPNGWGKTTFLRSISGNGTSVFVPTLPRWAPKTRCRGQTNRLPVRYLPVFSSALRQVRVRSLLKLFGCEPPSDISYLISRSVGTLSGGELKRVELVATLAVSDPNLFLLDEPTNALDANGIEFAARLIQKSAKLGLIVATEPSTGEDAG